MYKYKIIRKKSAVTSIGLAGDGRGRCGERAEPNHKQLPLSNPGCAAARVLFFVQIERAPPVRHSATHLHMTRSSIALIGSLVKSLNHDGRLRTDVMMI